MREILVDHAPDAALVLDADGTIVLATPSLEELIPAPDGRRPGARFRDLLHERDAPTFDRVLGTALERPGTTVRIDVRLRSPEGRSAELSMRSVHGGELGALVAVSTRDITERRAAEDELRSREARYRRLFEDDLTGDFVSTPDGRLLTCNTAFAELLGYDSVEDALGVAAIVHYVDPTLRAALIRRLEEAKQLKRIEIDLRRKDGRTVHVILNVVGVFDEAGNLESLQGNLFDITEQRRLADERTQLLVRERAARAMAEAAQRDAAFLAEVGSALDSSLDYRETLAKLARLVVPTLADYCLIDERTSDGGTRRVAVAHLDPQTERLLRPDEVCPPDADPARHPVLRVVQSGEALLLPEVSEASLDVLAHDGEHRELLRALGIRSYVIVPLTARGRTLGSITLVSSVSGRRYANRDLEVASAVARRAALSIDNARLYSRAQQAARKREEVLAFVSHDLRNPLATILLNASALIETIPMERLRDEEREQLEWIARSSEQMNRMIQDLLDVARIDSGRLPIQPAPTSVRQLLQDARTLFNPLVEESGLRIETFAPIDGPAAYIDRERCLRVLSNLIGNSIEFTPAGGVIHVSAAQVEGVFRIAVEDTGVGIAPEDAGRLFEPYWQGRRTGSGRNRGSGLGLAIAKGIVEAHGGSIWFDSAPGRGATFFFTVPIAQ